MALNHEQADRVPIHDMFWGATLDSWQQEGLPADVNPPEYFDLAIVRFSADASPRFPVEVIEETLEGTVRTTPFGSLRQIRKDRSFHRDYDYPCESHEDWERIKERLTPDPDRVNWDGQGMPWGRTVSEWRRGLPGCRKAREQGKFVCYNAGGVGPDCARHYLGPERVFLAMVEEPDLLRDIYEIHANLVIEMCEIMRAGGFEFDGAWVATDLGSRGRLLFSPEHFQQQVRPILQRLFDYFNGIGLPVIFHSDGFVRDLVPCFVEDGVTCLQPLEVKAGMDLVELKETFGQELAFMGGIDVRAMADPDPRVIEAEIATKIPFAKQGGGYIYHSDHSVPSDVSFDQYCRTLQLVKEYGAY